MSARGPRTRRPAVGATIGQGGTSLGPWWPRRSKYRAVPTTVDGFRFASKSEAKRYGELLLLGKIGIVRNLELQPRFPLLSNGVRVADYVADFRYDEEEMVWGDGGTCWTVWRDVVEDRKGFVTPVYKLKRKLFEAQYPTICFRETR